MRQAETKIIPLANLQSWRETIRRNGKTLAVTNGCFDLLHAGHIRFLQRARNLGDALLIGLNGDAGVRTLKGANRPINPQADRALILAALECVDAVSIFPETRAEQFLNLAAPDHYAKGGDYTLETLDPNERTALEKNGAAITIIPSDTNTAQSTTAIIKRIIGN